MYYLTDAREGLRPMTVMINQNEVVTWKGSHLHLLCAVISVQIEVGISSETRVLSAWKSGLNNQLAEV